MNNVKIQMAGIRNLQEALNCISLGVDIIGLLVGQNHNSNDFISVDQAKEITNNITGKAETTLITHLENAEQIIKLAKELNVDNIQLHSFIEEKEVKKIKDNLPNIKLIRIIHILQDGTILTDISKIKYVDYYFTDSINTKTNQIGGTGLSHNYNTDKSLKETLSKPLILAGGLTVDNVTRAIELVKPYAVDVNTGCKKNEGGRDLKKVKAFVENVRKAIL